MSGPVTGYKVVPSRVFFLGGGGQKCLCEQSIMRNFR